MFAPSRSVRLSGLLAVAILSSAATGAPQAYSDDEMKAAAPGPGWVLQPDVPDAPALRGAYIRARPNDRDSLITFAIDATPMPTDPGAYVQKGFDEILLKPPLSFRIAGKKEFDWGGSRAIRVEYADRDGRRQFVQIARATPRAGILVVTLQSPDAEAFREDQAALQSFATSIRLAPAAVPARGTAPPATRR